MKKIIQDIKNNLYIVNYVQKTSKLIFAMIIFGIIIEAIIYYVSTKFGYWIFDSVNVYSLQNVILFIIVVFSAIFIPKLINQWFSMLSIPIIYMKINERMNYYGKV